MEQFLDWDSSYGLFTGRSCYIFPEYSNRVFLGSNTLPMYGVCPRLNGLNEDIHSLFCESDASEENHWMYENSDLTQKTLQKLVSFLVNHDGVNIQLKNKDEMLERVEVRTINKMRVDGKERVVPEHYHHNWRFNDN